MKNLVTLDPFRLELGHKVGHLTICYVIKIFLNAGFANKKPVLVSEGVANYAADIGAIESYQKQTIPGHRELNTLL